VDLSFPFAVIRVIPDGAMSCFIVGSEPCSVCRAVQCLLSSGAGCLSV